MFLAKINFLLKVLQQFLSQIWLKPWLEKIITGYFVQWELWNVTWTRPRSLERTGLDCSFLSREITILQNGSIARWIAFTIKTTKDMSFLKVKAHQLRALCTSWAHFNTNSILNEVIQAAVWSNQTTFARFYLRDMHRQQHNLRLFGSSSGSPKSGGGMIWPLMDAK